VKAKRLSKKEKNNMKKTDQQTIAVKTLVNGRSSTINHSQAVAVKTRLKAGPTSVEYAR